MSRWRLPLNAGMGVAILLLVGGCALLFLTPSDSTLSRVGTGIVFVALTVYIVSRVALLLKERRS